MTIELKHYVEIFTTSLIKERIISEVPIRDPYIIKANPKIIGFRFFDRYEYKYNDYLLQSEPLNYSSNYLFGIKMSFEQAIQYTAKDLTVKRTIFNKDQVASLIHRAGICYPVLKDDIIINDKEDIIESPNRQFRKEIIKKLRNIKKQAI